MISLTAISRPGGNFLKPGIVGLVLAFFGEIGLHSPQHGEVGITFPVATPRGRSSSSHGGERLRLRM